MNWVDVAIVLTLLLFAAHGWRRGFIVLFIEFVGFVVAVAIPMLLYRPLTPVLQSALGWSHPMSKAGSFLSAWLAVWLVYAIGARMVYRRIPAFIRKSTLNKLAGAVPSLAKGIIFVALVVTLIVVFPSNGLPKDAVLHSAIGGTMVKEVSAVERAAAGIFGEALKETLTFITVKPDPASGESVHINKTTDVEVDPSAEKQMLTLLNGERVKRGLRPLKFDRKLQAVARAHSRDMFAKGYFAHQTPDGVGPFQRMSRAGISYMSAGENLAIAQTVEIAHRGLMNSAGHRANVLSRDYRRVGIGAIKSDVYGVMFSEEFTD